MDEILSDDGLMKIFDQMDIHGLVKVQRVSSRWHRASCRVLAGQQALGMAFSDRCSTRNHRIGWNQVINSKYFINEDSDLTIFEDIIRRCPNITCIYLTKSFLLKRYFYEGPLDEIDSRERKDICDDGSFGGGSFNSCKVRMASVYDILAKYCGRLECLQFGYHVDYSTFAARLLPSLCDHLIHCTWRMVNVDTAEQIFRSCPKLVAFGLYFVQDTTQTRATRDQMISLLDNHSSSFTELYAGRWSGEFIENYSTKLENLQSLWIRFPPRATCRQLEKLKYLKNLKSLAIDDSRTLSFYEVTTIIEALGELEKLKSIRWVTSHWSTMTDLLIVKCKNLQQIEMKSFFECGIRWPTIKSILELKFLRSLKVIFVGNSEELNKILELCCQHRTLTRLIVISQAESCLSATAIELCVKLANNRPQEQNVFVEISDRNFADFPNLDFNLPENLLIKIETKTKLYKMSGQGVRTVEGNEIISVDEKIGCFDFLRRRVARNRIENRI